MELVQYSQDPLPSIKKVTLRLWAHNAKKAKQGEWSIPSGNLETLPKCRPGIIFWQSTIGNLFIYVITFFKIKGDILLAYPVIAKELDDDSLVFEIGAQITRDRAFFVFSSETIRASNFSPKITDIIPSASSAKNSFEDENKTALKKIIETAINTHLSKISSDLKQLYDQESFISDRNGQYQGNDWTKIWKL